MKTISYIFLGITILFLQSCDMHFNLGLVEGNGNVLKKERGLNAKFHKIKASNGLNVHLVEGNSQKITIEADENLHDYIQTEISGGELLIKSSKNIGKASSKKVIVTYTALDGVTASSGASINANTTLVAENLFLKSSSGAAIEIDVTSKELTAQSSSGSSLRISGRAKLFDVKASSGSNIDSKNLETYNCNAKASSGAEIATHVFNAIDAKASSGGNIKYYGNPKNVNHKKSSSGSVRKM